MFEIVSSPAFVLGSLVLVVLALAFVVAPLWSGSSDRVRIRRRRRALEELREELGPEEYQRRMDGLRQQAAEAEPDRRRGLATVLIVLIPLAATVLYLEVGSPKGIDPEPGQTGQLRQLLGELAADVRAEPENVEAWNRLGMIWKRMQQFPAAEAAFRRVLYIEPDNTLARVELAETLLYASGQARLPDESKALLDAVLRDDPDNQKALWLAGINAFHAGDSERALALWTRLERVLPAGEVREQVREQIAQIEQAPTPASREAAPAEPAMANPHAAAIGRGQAGTPPADSAAQPSEEQPVSADRIAVSLELAPDLRGRVDGSETLFVFARAVDGPPAPLAVRRLTASALPTTIVLSERDSMAEGLTLTTFPEVRISARISESGNAIAVPGDLEGRTGALRVADTDEVSIVIDEVIGN